MAGEAVLLLSSNGAVQVGDTAGVLGWNLLSRVQLFNLDWNWQMFPHEHGKLMCPTTIFGLCRSSLISSERLVFMFYIFRVKVQQTDLGGGVGILDLST